MHYEVWGCAETLPNRFSSSLFRFENRHFFVFIHFCKILLKSFKITFTAFTVDQILIVCFYFFQERIVRAEF